MLPEWRKFLLRYLNNYDGLILSCEKYKRELLNSNFEGSVYQLYPHIDPDMYGEPSQARLEEFCEEYEIQEEDEIIFVIGRLDPMKGQDVAIKGLAQIARDYPDVKLLLVGNGSFSSNEKGGLGLPKGLRWKKELESLASSLGISDRIIFTGFIPDEDLEAALTRADLLLLPSLLEGFGITVLEGWLYKKPVVVSSEAGVSELVENGENGYVFDPSQPEELAKKMDKILSDHEHAEELGEKGYEKGKECHLENIGEELTEIMEEIIS